MLINILDGKTFFDSFRALFINDYLDIRTYSWGLYLWLVWGGINWADSTVLVFSKTFSNSSLGYFLRGLLVVFISCFAETS